MPPRFKQASINRSITIALLTIAFSSIFSVGSFWIYSEISLFQKSRQQQERVFTEEKKFQLKQEVERAIAYINFKRSQSEQRLRNDIQNRTNEAYAIATSLYEQNKERLSKDHVGDLIKDALRPIRFNNGRGYYFATRLDGVVQLFADRPDLEGLNLLAMRDDAGRYVIQDMIELVKQKEEGLYRYNWTKPGKEKRSYPKIAFIKYFKPLNWLIGTGEYLDDVNQDIQAEVLSRIEQIKFGDDGYIFVGTYEGVSLIKPAKGKNMYHVEDPNGVKIVQELIAAARAGGGYVNYVMPQFKGIDNAPKLSYAAGVDDWNWYVGAGIYIGEIEQIIAAEKEKLLKRIYNHLIQIGLTLLFAGLAIFFLVGFFSRKIGRNLHQFATFFSNSSRNYTAINLEDLGYTEFEELALSANRMIEERNHNEQKMQESKQWIETILNSIQSGIMVIDADKHRIIDVNPEAERMIGSAREHIIGKRCHKFVCEADEGNCPITTKDYNIVNEEKTLRRIDGTDIPIIKTAKQITLHGNTYLIESFIDISEKKRLEAQLHQTEKLQALGTLSGGIAHDFNNLLMGIQGRTELMLDHCDKSDPCVEHLKSIQEYISSAATLTNQLLGIARGGKYDVKPADMNTIIKHQGELFRRTKKEIIITGKYAPDLWAAEVDQGQMEQVLWNLFINAHQAMPDGGNITISTSNTIITPTKALELETVPGNFIEIRVKDTGVGMEHDTLQKIFDPFFTTKEKGRGTGLGLASVYGIVRNHGGSIQVTSTPGNGSEFIILLPATELEPAIGSEELPAIIRGSGVIFLIDDEEMIRDVGAEMLKLLGYEVLTAASGAEALEVYRHQQKKIDLVILDIIMPGMNGGQVFEKLRELNPDVKVIIASGYSLDSEAHKLLKSGCSGFIQKPFNLESLSLTVAECNSISNPLPAT